MTDWILRFIKGALIGVGAILPGISGGVLSVVLGIYRPMMAFLAHPIKTFGKQAAFFVPVLIGWVVGVVVLARAVDWLFRTSPTPAIWLFIGLVAGTIPSLWKEAGGQGRGKSSWIALLAGGILMGAWMYVLSSAGGTNVTPSVLWWLLCGVLWGLGLIVPGMSPSSFFIFFGLYQPMTAAIGSFDMTVILPIAAGLLLTVVIIARGMNLLLSKRYSIVMHAIIGIVIASTIAILPLQEAASAGQILVYAACFLVGCAMALSMDWLSRKYAPAEAPSEGASVEQAK